MIKAAKEPMKIFYLLRLALISLLFLTSCSNGNKILYQTRVNNDLVREAWMQGVQVNPNVWASHGDVWYLTGEANQTERSANYAPYTNAMTIAAVKVPQFTKVNVTGNLQVQLVGLQEQNSVYVLGTNAALRQTSVKVFGDTLYIVQSQQGEADPASLNGVIVRVGVHNLRELCVSGGGTVEGRNLMSDNLKITSFNNCMVLLNGNMNLTKVEQMGGGSVSVIGANSPNLDLIQNGRGTINISGRVGVHRIVNAGSGKINVIGLNSNSLSINASGYTSTSLAGYANLKKLTAQGCSQVYLYWINSDGAYINEQDSAVVGLAGCATNLNINLSGDSRLYGRYLHGRDVYIRTNNFAHANIGVDQKLFAAASDNSSIYYFGMPSSVSRFRSKSGTILPVWADTPSTPPMQPVRQGAWTTPYGRFK